MVILAGFGNPLLDITVKTNSKQLLTKYNLKDDDQCEINEIMMTSLLQDIKDLPIEYTPGGSVQNTLRIFQWLSKNLETTYMIGAIGNDENGAILKKLVEYSGVKTKYIINNNLPTGITVAITNGENRSLVASIGAAKEIDTELFNKMTNNDELLNEIDLFYMEGFFIPHRETCAKHIVEFSKAHSKLFVFNISAPYICQDNKNNIKYFAENCDILFGNMKEYEALTQAINFSGNVLDLALFLNSTSIHKNWQYRKVIVITNGSKTVTCVHSKNQISTYDVPKIPIDDIQDTTGAGDSFVAGFLFGLFKNCSPDICLKYGCWTAQQIIKQIGCQIPSCLPEINTSI